MAHSGFDLYLMTFVGLPPVSQGIQPPKLLVPVHSPGHAIPVRMSNASSHPISFV